MPGRTRHKQLAGPKPRNAADLTARNNNARKTEIATLRALFEDFVTAVENRFLAHARRLGPLENEVRELRATVDILTGKIQNA